MLYFKVKGDSHNRHMGKGWHLVANELITEPEISRRKFDINIIKECSENVNINPKNTFFCFGARFEKTQHNDK